MVNLAQRNPLPSKIMVYWLVKIGLIFVIFALPFAAMNPGFGLVHVGFILVILAVPVLILYLDFLNFSFSVDENKLTINSGIITKSSKAISFASVQNVSVVSGIVQRFFGLASVKIWTASPGQIMADRQGHAGREPDGSLILDAADAEWLKNFIADRRGSGI